MSLKAQQARVQQAEQALQARVAETSSQARQLAAVRAEPERSNRRRSIRPAPAGASPRRCGCAGCR